MSNLYWLIPEIFLSFAIITLLIFGVIYTQIIKLTWLTNAILCFTVFIYLEQLTSLTDLQIPLNIFHVTLIGLLIKIVLCLTTIFILLLSKEEFINRQIKDFEYLNLILLAILGMSLLVSSNNLIIFYLSLELLSLSLYILTAINRQSEFSAEAGLKYFILGSLNAGFFLLGSAIIYSITGDMSFDSISNLLSTNVDNLMLIAGCIFIIIAILFKLAAAPFHMWAPDVYEGAPTIVTTFLTTVPKLAILGAFINIIWHCFMSLFCLIQSILLIAILASLCIGSISALSQTKIKRLVAYGAISQVGFMLIGLLSGSIEGIHTTLIFIFIYILLSIAIFSLILLAFKQTHFITELSGLSRRHPAFAVSFTLILLSVAGIPPLAGFYSKYLILSEALENKYVVIAIIGVLAASVSIFYYLRIIKWIFFKDSTDFHFKNLADLSTTAVNFSLIRTITLSLTLFLILTVLIYHDPLSHIIYEALFTL